MRCYLAIRWPLLLVNWPRGRCAGVPAVVASAVAQQALAKASALAGGAWDECKAKEGRGA